MPDYSKAKIYAIKSDQYDKIYIGSTCRPLNIRLNEHKCRKYYVKKEKSKEILKYNDAKIYLIENFPCLNKNELRKREGEIIRQNNCVNIQIAGRTTKMWIDENKDHVVKQLKERRNEKILCPLCDVELNRSSLTKHKKRKHNDEV